jgi:hypothetical protein
MLDNVDKKSWATAGLTRVAAAFTQRPAAIRNSKNFVVRSMPPSYSYSAIDPNQIFERFDLICINATRSAHANLASAR